MTAHILQITHQQQSRTVKLGGKGTVRVQVQDRSAYQIFEGRDTSLLLQGSHSGAERSCVWR